MNVETSSAGSLIISGTLHIDAADLLRDVILKQILSEQQSEVELRGVDACDTACAQVLLAAQKTASRLGKTLRFTAIPPAVAATTIALGLSPDLSIENSENE